MKDPTLAPIYACLYPGLCDIARSLGYALAIHGSLQRDMDLVAVPWTEQACDAETVASAIRTHANACLYGDLLKRGGHFTDAQVEQILRENEKANPKARPHGRVTFSLHLDCGGYIDLSVMPRLAL